MVLSISYWVIRPGTAVDEYAIESQIVPIKVKRRIGKSRSFNLQLLGKYSSFQF